ncbi:protein zyg-11 homolog B-like [Antedon mediterranea]|uniref:protein zyg-11 homolog B-like n=1 Tax=Antedon mediterranea TaxID=105859 RepID=UPI003AF9B933
MIELILEAMSNFSRDGELQANAIRTIRNERIIQEVDFDYFQACRMVIKTLFVFEDQPMILRRISLCATLINKMPIKQVSELCTKKNVQKLLQILKQKSDNIDIVDSTLIVIINLSNESSSVCEIFVNEGGLELFIEILQSFPNASIRRYVLNLFRYIAKVEHLRHVLLREDIIEHCRRLLLDSEFKVSYAAAGTLSHLALERNWGSCKQRIDILSSLHSKVLSWKNPGRVIRYRTFSSLFPLLELCDKPGVQLWVVWTLHYVCTENPSLKLHKEASDNCSMLQEEGGVDILLHLLSSPEVHPDVNALAHKVLQILLD